ncbi:MAG: SpoIIE family protein phosphatase [Bacteroidales bacterium]|nr:SpoIIE family protein phosphatase [Bacteroidales bacterium]
MILAVMMAVPWVANAQKGVEASIDSLKNQIARDTSKERLAILHYELANKYLEAHSYRESSQAAQRASVYAKECNDLSTQLNCCLLLGNNNMLLGESVASIQNYLQARKVIERRAEEIQKQFDEHLISQKAADGFLRHDRETDADIVMQMGRVYFNRRHFDRAIDCFNEAKASYDILGLADKSIETKKHLATGYYHNNDFDNALKYYDELLSYNKEKNDWVNTKMNYQRINDILIKKKDYPMLEKYNRELYNECIKNDGIKEQLNAYNNMNYALVCQKKYSEAVLYFNQLINNDQAFAYDDADLANLWATSYTNIGLCYHNMGDAYYDKATEQLRKAYDMRAEYNQDKEAAHVANLLAHIYVLHGDFHNAEYYQKLALQHAETSDDRETLKEVYLGCNDVYKRKGDYEKALDYYENFRALDEQDRRDQEDINRKKQEDLKSLNDAEKNYQDALNEADIRERQERENQLRLEQAEAARAMAEKQLEIQEMQRKAAEAALILEREKFQRNEAEKQIALEKQKLLEEQMARQAQENELTEARSKQAELLLEQERNQRVMETQKQEAERYLLFMLLAGIVILFFIGFVIAMRKKNKKLKEQQIAIERANADLQMKNDEITAQKENLIAANNEILTKNEELSRQKEVIEQANKSITDSIVYAKRIQTAVSPSPKFLQAFNLQHFLFFRPRDIVSGDYYWFHADNNSIFVVAADCTGHGVPGAFMSMLGLSLFNKIVAERNITEPDLILNHLRAEVKMALHQDSINSSQKDGMDLSLVRYDVDTKMLHFAAANNNGYLVQHFCKDQEEQAKANLLKPEHLRETEDGYLRLTIMPADSMPIGVYIREKESFTKSSYQLKEGDSFYLTSDGYIDQFGGKWGRKFLTKNFQKLVMDINSYDMKHQEKIVIETHENWIGDSYDQLDDIIVIGIRV